MTITHSMSEDILEQSEMFYKGDSNVRVKMRNGLGVFEGRTDAVLFKWNPMGVSQYPEQTHNNRFHNN